MNEKEMIHYEDELFEELSKNKIKRTDILTDLNVALQEYQILAANIKDVREIQEYKIAVVSVESELKELQRENNQLKEQLEKEKEVKSKAIGHINACGGELTKDECKYLLQILNIDKGE